MLGLIWGPAGTVDHRGDGERAPVTVRGTDGTASELTVFQQVVLPELGTVVSWEEDGLAIGLYGRGWAFDEADQLVAIADRIELDADGTLDIPDAALPQDLVEVYRGRLLVVPLVPAPAYRLHYRSTNGGTLHVQGVVATTAELETIRFLAPELTHDGAAIVGRAWDEEGGPTVVAWHPTDDLAVVAVGFGIELADVRAFADRTRPLTADEWSELLLAEPGEACV